MNTYSVFPYRADDNGPEWFVVKDDVQIEAEEKLNKLSSLAYNAREDVRHYGWLERDDPTSFDIDEYTRLEDIAERVTQEHSEFSNRFKLINLSWNETNSRIQKLKDNTHSPNGEWNTHGNIYIYMGE